jgi:hypothetical protein
MRSDSCTDFLDELDHDAIGDFLARGAVHHHPRAQFAEAFCDAGAYALGCPRYNCHQPRPMVRGNCDFMRIELD